MIASPKHTGRLSFRPQSFWRDCLTTVLVLATAAGPVVAQPDTDTEGATHGLERWQSVSVITRKDIETSGMITLDELLSDRADANSFGLRQPLLLGYRILVNGRHPIHSLDLVPLSTVERIEVLRNGAAAMDDGSAVAGAINILLREDLDGFEVTAMGGLPQASGGQTGQASLLWGGGVGRGHLVVGVDSIHRGKITAADRDYSRPKWSQGGSFAGTSHVSIGGNTVFFSEEGRTVARALGNCSTGLDYTGVLSNPASVDGEGCGFAWGNIAWNTERFNSKSVFANLDYPLGDAASFYINGRLVYADTAFRYAPSVGQFTIPNPSADLLKAAGAKEGPLTVYHRFLSHGNRDWNTDHDEHDVTFGLRGKAQENASWDLSINRYRRTERETGNTFVSESLAIQAIEAGEYDLTNPRSTDPNHQAAVDRMALDMQRDEVVDVTAVKAALQGPGFALPGGNLQWMVGFEIDNQERKDIMKHRDRDGKIYPLEDVLGSGGISYEGQRSRKSGFVEVQFPPLPDWTILLAAQLDDYDDVDSTQAWTMASAWRANERLTLHGSFQKGSSPPSLSNLHSTDEITHPYVCDTKNHTDPAVDCDITQIKTIRGNNPDLEPSQSTTWGFGGIMELGRFSLAADWFQIETDDVPARVSPQSIVDREAQQGSSALVARQNDVIMEIQNPLVNTGESRVSGLSLSGHTDWDMGSVATDLDIHWNYIIESESKVDGMVQPGDFPHNRVHATLRMAQNNMVAAWHTRVISGYDNVQETGNFDPWIGHDLTLEFRDVFGMEGLAMQGGVLNLTNRGPSVDSSNPNVADERLDSERGRTFFLRTELSW